MSAAYVEFARKVYRPLTHCVLFVRRSFPRASFTLRRFLFRARSLNNSCAPLGSSIALSLTCDVITKVH